jgi:hypothetical protein
VHFRRDAAALVTAADVAALLERHFPAGPAGGASFELDPGYRACDEDGE